MTRPIARRLLAGDRELESSLGKTRVISSEGLIGFKLQRLVNNPRRTQVKSAKPSQYPFAAEGGLEGRLPEATDPFKGLELMAVIEALCTTWPERQPFTAKGQWRM